MVVTKKDNAKGAVESRQQETLPASNGCIPAEDYLSVERLDGIFEETDPHQQFKLFAKRLGIPHAENMSPSTRITTEYDYLNVMFCREQNFTTEQTSAFRETAREVFEAAIVRGELDLNGAFQAFAERVLALSGAAPPQEESAQLHRLSPSTAGETSPSLENACTSVDDAQPCLASRMSLTAQIRTSTTGKHHKKSMPSPTRIDAPNAGAEAMDDPRGGNDNANSNKPEEGPVFSVTDVATIAEFVARGLFRNFALYRACFERPARVCREIRGVRVETTLAPPPLAESEEVT